MSAASWIDLAKTVTIIFLSLAVAVQAVQIRRLRGDLNHYGGGE